MSAVRVLGRSSDGTLSVCRAKPENRGRPPCYHTDHVETDADDATIARYNEEAMSKALGTVSTMSRRSRPHGSGTVVSHNGRSLTRGEFNEAVETVSDQFAHEDYTFIRDFYSKFGDRVSNQELRAKFNHASDNIYDFIQSDDPVAVRTREFLGDDVDMKVFSKIIATNVGAMTSSERWRNDGKRRSVQRVVLTSVMNDMNRERYVASVMFFGGRCCYCRRPFKEAGSGKGAASGEHLTPVNAQNPPPGATRYGNMALACIGCNHDRENKDLNEWMKKTKRIPEKDKQEVLDRIKAFRKFALYREMNEKQVAEVNRTVNAVNAFMSRLPAGADRKLSKEDSARTRSVLNSQIARLRERLR